VPREPITLHVLKFRAVFDIGAEADLFVQHFG
jgi:hypothetical protein